jgi:hypothetical protein
MTGKIVSTVGRVAITGCLLCLLALRNPHNDENKTRYFARMANVCRRIAAPFAACSGLRTNVAA